jgi:putative oxidoreductase
MIHMVVFAPIVVAGGGLLGFAHEGFRRKRLAVAISHRANGTVSADRINAQNVEVVAADNVTGLKFAERTAHIALGVTAAGLLFYPPLGLLSLPFIGYSAYNWLRARYPSEREWQWLKAPSTTLAIAALSASLLTGYWIISALVLTLDLRLRRGWASPRYQELHQRFMRRARVGLRRALLGEPRWEWFPSLLARVSLGLFFAISGWNKLFLPTKWAGLVATMANVGLPFPKFLALFLASVEFYGGALLTIGFLSTLWAIALAFAMVVAIITVEIPLVIPPGLGPLDWLDWFLYLPQVMYVILFLWLIIKGPGPYSVDAIIARNLGLDNNEGPDTSDKRQDDNVNGAPDADLVPA